jgi:hypothetical protein
MATGPQRYPGASTAYFYQNRYGGDLMEVNVVVLHTTEGRTLPDYDGGAVAPNLTALPDFTNKRLKWYQHFDIDRSSRALVNLAGGVETNTLNVVQVELVGTCDPATHTKWTKAGYAHIYWPEAPDWALQGVADFLAWAHTNHHIPLTGPALWLPYPQSGAADSNARMSFAQWENFNGICGHMHVPEQDHGDPGAIDFPHLLALAKGDTPTAPEEPDVALTDADVERIATAVWQKMAKADGVYLAPTDATDYSPDVNHPGHYWSGRTVFADLVRRVRDIQKTVADLAAAQKTKEP